MKIFRIVLITALALSAGWAFADGDDFVMGNYSGDLYVDGESVLVRAQVVNRSYEYQIFLYVTPPDSYEEVRLELSGKRRRTGVVQTDIRIDDVKVALAEEFGRHIGNDVGVAE